MRDRLVLLGLDGVSVDLARRLTNLPHMAGLPNLASLLPGATPVDAELPELSPVNWTSLLTGVGPEEHGVFGFTRLDPRSYSLSIADASWIRTPTILSAASAKGLTVRSLNVPTTSPPSALGPLKGMVVGGFVARDLRQAVHPPLLAPMLAQAGYLLEGDTVAGKDDHDRLLGELHAALDGRRAAFDLLWQGQDFDLFLAVLTETDRLFHFLLHAVQDTSHPLHGDCMLFLSRLDQVLGHMLSAYHALPGPKRLLVAADHGFSLLKTEVDVNTWLLEHGFLRLQGQGHELDASVISPASRAFALDPGRVYVHDSARFARGPVPPQDAARVAGDLRHGLLALRHDGKPVFRAVHVGAELYPGASGPDVPDLLCEPHSGFSPTAKFDGRPLFGLHGRSGVHDARGAMFWDSNGRRDRPQRLRDVGREMFAHFGLQPGAKLR